MPFLKYSRMFIGVNYKIYPPLQDWVKLGATYNESYAMIFREFRMNLTTFLKIYTFEVNALVSPWTNSSGLSRKRSPVY